MWTALRVVYGLVQAKALKLGVPSTIVRVRVQSILYRNLEDS